MCSIRFHVLSSRLNNPDLGSMKLFLPLLGLSMVAGLLMLGDGQASRSVKLGLDPVLPLLVVPFGPCCRVAMVAALKLQSTAIKEARAGSYCEPKDQPLKVSVQAMLKLEGGVVNRAHLMLAPALGAGCEFGLAPCWELAAMPHQVHDHKADASGIFAESSGLLLQISMGNRFEGDSMVCKFFPMFKDWNLSGTAHGFAVSFTLTSNQFYIWRATIRITLFLLLHVWYNLVKFEKHIILDRLVLKILSEKMICKNVTQPPPVPNRCGVLLVMQVNGNSWQNGKFNHDGHQMLNLELVRGPFEQNYSTISWCTMLPLMDGALVEDTVPLLFGLCHRRWMTTPSLLILRFNGGDILRLSSVKVIQYLQLNSFLPQVHTPDRPPGEPPAGHQLVWSIKEAFEDCSCSMFDSELSSDKRPLFGSNCSLRYLLRELWPSCTSLVHLSTFGSCSLLLMSNVMFWDR